MCPWENIPNSAIYIRYDDDGARFQAIEGFGSPRWMVYLYADGDQFGPVRGDDREALAEELRESRRYAAARREAERDFERRFV